MSRLLWFHPRWPFPPRGGGDLRTSGLVAGAVLAEHQVLLVAPADRWGSGAPVPGAMQVVALDEQRGATGVVTKALSAHPLRSPRIRRHSNRDAEKAIAEFQPELAVVSEVMSWSFARHLMPAGTPWVYDAHNVESALFKSHLDHSQGWERPTMAVDRVRVTRAERALIAGASTVLAVSEVDAAAIRHIAPGTNVVVVPSSVSTPEAPVDPGAADPNALFVGSLDFPPNVAAIEQAINDVFPEVRMHCPEARLLVVGRRPSSRIRQLLGSRSWIDFVEDAPDIAFAYSRSRLALLPFGAGGGTKLKVYEAMAFGLPVVTTPEGVAGIALPADSGVVVSETTGLGDAAVSMLTTPDLARRLGANARRAFLGGLSWEQAAYPVLQATIERYAG